MMVLSSVKYDKYNNQHNVTILSDTSKEASDHSSDPDIDNIQEETKYMSQILLYLDNNVLLLW